jgi:hypothetical protein
MGGFKGTPCAASIRQMMTFSFLVYHAGEKRSLARDQGR